MRLYWFLLFLVFGGMAYGQYDGRTLNDMMTVERIVESLNVEHRSSGYEGWNLPEEASGLSEEQIYLNTNPVPIQVKHALSGDTVLIQGRYRTFDNQLELHYRDDIFILDETLIKWAKFGPIELRTIWNERIPTSKRSLMFFVGNGKEDMQFGISVKREKLKLQKNPIVDQYSMDNKYQYEYYIVELEDRFKRNEKKVSKRVLKEYFPGKEAEIKAFFRNNNFQEVDIKHIVALSAVIQD